MRNSGINGLTIIANQYARTDKTSLEMKDAVQKYQNAYKRWTSSHRGMPLPGWLKELRAKADAAQRQNAQAVQVRSAMEMFPPLR